MAICSAAANADAFNQFGGGAADGFDPLSGFTGGLVMAQPLATQVSSDTLGVVVANGFENVFICGYLEGSFDNREILFSGSLDDFFRWSQHGSTSDASPESESQQAYVVDYTSGSPAFFYHQFSAVPEPGGLLLLLIGVGMAGCTRRWPRNAPPLPSVR